MFQGTAHAVDFYINGECQWAIEFLVNSNRIKEHNNRFHSEKGVYSAIPYKQYIIVNFIDVSEKDKNAHPGLMNVKYTKTFDKWFIEYNNGTFEIPISTTNV